jgi:hypothetical protein
VSLYLDFILNKQVEPFFKKFYFGFHEVCKGDFLFTFEPEELELMICGNPVLDFKALQKVTIYEEIDENSNVVKWFWQVVHELSPEQKKKFLFFCTGCDRAPINGLGSLKFVLSRTGADEVSLPSVHTCFNHLILPDYSTIEML